MQKILIVEDIDYNVDLLVQLLEDQYELVAAGDGAEGVALAAQERPDLILMDMSLPIMDGLEATRQIRLDRTLRSVPIIGLSAHAMNGEADFAIQAGCNDYLTKPVDETLLFEKIKSYLA